MTTGDRWDWREFGKGLAIIGGVISVAVGSVYWLVRLVDGLNATLGLRTTRQVEAAVAATTQATVTVHEEVRQLAQETARAQKLAVWVGVGTAVLGAVLGGFAGAVAARLLGA